MFKSLMQNTQKREEGQGLVEYALILVLVAVVVIVVLSLVGPGVGNIFSEVVTALNGGASAGEQVGGEEDPGDPDPDPDPYTIGEYCRFHDVSGNWYYWYRYEGSGIFSFGSSGPNPNDFAFTFVCPGAPNPPPTS